MAIVHDVFGLIERTLASLDTPGSLKIKLLIANGQWDDLTSLSVDPLDYIDSPWGAEQYWREAQAVALVKKLPELPTTFDKSEVARDGFWSCEKQCKATNDRLSIHLYGGPFEGPLQYEADRLIGDARAFCARVLKGLPTALDGQFGPGSTYESKDSLSGRSLGLTAYSKLADAPCATPRAASFADHLVWETAFGKPWGDALPGRLIPLVRGNRFATVPKDSSKDRGIAIEPGLNILGQKAIGKAIRSRLRIRAGIDLDTGQELHRQMACSSSLTGDYATIDLSNASDTVCRVLVKLLLPDLWFDLLNSFRSPFTEVEGKMCWLEKFSSMGNGFTFELETLIYCALCAAAGCEVGIDAFVYGDDIIVPSDRADDVIALLRYCGFTPNAKKTFTRGGFRESCGGDFLCGIPVRPVYLKTIPSEPLHWIQFHNLFVRKNAGHWCRMRRSALYCFNRVPRSLRLCQCPPALGDIGLHLRVPKYRDRHGIRYYRCIKLLPRLVKPQRFGANVVLASALLGYSSLGLAPRGSVAGWTLSWVPYS